MSHVLVDSSVQQRELVIPDLQREPIVACQDATLPVVTLPCRPWAGGTHPADPLGLRSRQHSRSEAH